MLQDFASLRLSPSILGGQSNNCHPWSSMSELLLSILIVYKQMIEETGVFVCQARREMNAMVCSQNQIYALPTHSGLASVMFSK
jgi:hypothetical protein